MRKHGYQNFATSLQHSDGEVKSVLVIVNPNSGKGRGLLALEELRSVLQKREIKVQIKLTEYAGHCRKLCETEDLTDFDCLAPIGGDGTLCEAINGLMRRTDGKHAEILLAIVPAGTGNTVAYDMGIANAKQAGELILNHAFRLIDLAKVQSLEDFEEVEYSINMCGWAMASSVLIEANRYRRFGLGAWYNFAAYKYLLTDKTFEAKITITLKDDEELVLQDKWGMFCLQNTVHMGAKMPLCPSARVDDGLLDLTLMTSSGVAQNIKTMSLASKGKHTTRKQIQQYQVKAVKLENSSEAALWGKNTVNIDGEMSSSSPCVISVIPACLRVLCPET